MIIMYTIQLTSILCHRQHLFCGHSSSTLSLPCQILQAVPLSILAIQVNLVAVHQGLQAIPLDVNVEVDLQQNHDGRVALLVPHIWISVWFGKQVCDDLLVTLKSCKVEGCVAALVPHIWISVFCFKSTKTLIQM